MNTQKNRPKRSLADAVSGSLILPFFYQIACFLYQSVKESVVGHFFCSYDRENAEMKDSALSRAGKRIRFSERILRPMRFRIASQFDNSAILNLLRAYFRRLAGMSLNTYGVSCLFFSLSTAVIYIIRYMTNRESSYADIVVAAIVLLIGICLVASHSHLSEALCQSRLCAAFLFRLAGADEEYFREAPKTHGRFPIAALIGALLGVLTFRIPPHLVLIGIAGLIAAFLIYKIPEFGVAAVMFLAPFLPTMLLVVCMMYLILCFCLKYLRGKRAFHVSWLDFTVLMFMTILLFAGLFSVSPRESIFPVLVFLCFMSGYFLTVNLIRSKIWVQRCLFSLLSSSVIVALYGVYQNFFAAADTTWQDKAMFSDISGRVVSTLENPNVLAEYLIMILPVSVAGLLVCKTASQKLCCLFSAGILGACLIFTWSRGAWLGLLLAMTLFLLMYSKKVLVIGLFGILAIPFLPFVLPDAIINRFMSIGNLRDTSTSYRVHIWEGVFSMLKDHLLGGIGVGTKVFAEVYPRYSLSGIEMAPHSHNLYLQILVECGIFGFLLFVLFLFTFAKRGFSFYAKPLPMENRLFSAALFSGIIAVLIQGMTDYIWYNYRVFLVFWLIVGLFAAICQTTETENCGSLKNTQESVEAASMDIICTSRKGKGKSK